MPVPQSQHSIASGQRFASLDVIRGVIIFAILIININYFALPNLIRYNPLAWGEVTQADKWVWFFEYALIKQRFMPLLSLMFGAGLYLFALKFAQTNQSSLLPYLKRSVILILFGLVHAYLVWDGDILVAYALCGIVAYFMRNLPVKWLVILGLLLVFGPIAQNIYASVLAVGSVSDDPAFWQLTQEQADKAFSAYDKSYLALIPERMDVAFGRQTTDFLYFTLWRVTGCMLLGIALIRTGFLLGQGRVKQAAIITGIVGYPMSVVFAYQYVQLDFAYHYFESILALSFYFGSVILAFHYLCLLILWANSDFAKSVQTFFAKVGTMALSIYLMQSIICACIFYGYGLHWYGQLGRAELMLLTLAIWVFQSVFVVVWLSYFKQGPLEAVWRHLYNAGRSSKKRNTVAADVESATTETSKN